MRYRDTVFLAAAASLFLAVGTASAQITINEVRVDNTGTDTDEYFELKGPPNASLNGYYYIVIGDAAGTLCGTIESVTNLTGKTIQADGYFALRNVLATPVLAGYDASDSLFFENTDNVTHMLVTNFTGTRNVSDVDANNDGVIDATFWTTIVDAVGIVKVQNPVCGSPLATDEPVYTATQVGPDPASPGNPPGHIWRCRDTGVWQIGPFNIAGGQDTPGTQNASCASPPPNIALDTRNICAPLVGQAVVVTDSIPAATSASLSYSINGGGPTVVAMASIGSSKWQATIPAQGVNGTRVSYFVTGTNAQGSDIGFTQGYFVGFVTIATIRPVDANGVTLYKFYGVNLSGSVTAAQGTFSTTLTDFWFQDGTGGIHVFGSLGLGSPALGDQIEVGGVIDQFNGSLEITSSGTCGNLDINNTGPGAVPAALLTNTCDIGEATEGKLVKLQYPFVDTTGTNSGGVWLPNKGYAMNNCATTAVDLFIDADTDIDGTPQTRLQIEVTGISTQFDTATPFLSGYEVVPRGLSDIKYLGSVSGVGDGAASQKPRLFQSSPNPFSQSTKIQYEIGKASNANGTAAVRINIFDIAGRKITTLVDDMKAPGLYSAELSSDRLGVASGIFFYSLEVDGQVIGTHKLVLQK